MTKPAVGAPALADAASHDLLAAFTTIFDYLPGARYDVREGVVRMVSGLVFPPFNGVASTRPDVAATDVLTAVDEFARGGLPWNVQLRAGYPDDLDVALAARGLVVTGDIPLMVLDDPAALGAAVHAAPLDYKRVTVADLPAYGDVMAAGFGMPGDLVLDFMVPGLVTDPAVHVVIGRAAGRDVTTGLSLRVGDGAGIFNIATPAEHRGKGYGAAVTALVVLRAFDAGATWSWLQASPLGEPVYERLGFRTVETWRQWMPRDQLPPAD